MAAAPQPIKKVRRKVSSETVESLEQQNMRVAARLKNPTKWLAVAATGSLILEQILPMKMPSDFESTRSHTIKSLTARFPRLGMIIDLQNSNRAYDTVGTDVKRHICRLVSKQIPQEEQVDLFCEILTGCLAQANRPIVAVHCHYGFNRTGFLICCFLITRRGFDVATAIQMFAVSRPPGIRHQHFIDTLWSRYTKQSSPRQMLNRRVTLNRSKGVCYKGDEGDDKKTSMVPAPTNGTPKKRPLPSSSETPAYGPSEQTQKPERMKKLLR